MAWKREDWNDIIRQVNDLCQNPDSGCEAISPLDEVGEKHVWRPDDIIAVRNKLLEICPENIFEAEIVKWKRNLIDEIEAAIGNGWCGCCEWDGPYSLSLPIETEESDHSVKNPTSWGWPVCHGSHETWTASQFIMLWDIQLGPVGYVNRKYALSVTGTREIHSEGETYYCEPNTDDSTPITLPMSYGTIEANGYATRPPGKTRLNLVTDRHHVWTSSSGYCCSGYSDDYYNLVATITIGSHEELQTLGFNPTGDNPGTVVCL